jgi:hypothetical protein
MGCEGVSTSLSSRENAFHLSQPKRKTDGDVFGHSGFYERMSMNSYMPLKQMNVEERLVAEPPSAACFPVSQFAVSSWWLESRAMQSRSTASLSSSVADRLSEV